MSDILDIPSSIKDALATLGELLVRLEADMVSSPKFAQKHATAAAAIAQATKALSTEARLWAEQAASRASDASPEQRTAVCIKWLTRLPKAIRAIAYDSLIAAEKAQPDALRLTMEPQ